VFGSCSDSVWVPVLATAIPWQSCTSTGSRGCKQRRICLPTLACGCWAGTGSARFGRVICNDSEQGATCCFCEPDIASFILLLQFRFQIGCTTRQSESSFFNFALLSVSNLTG
jgi:hypothetical protein